MADQFFEQFKPHTNEPIEDDFFNQFDSDEIEQSPNPINIPNPIGNADTFSSGFMNSLTSGEALDAGMKGLKGYAKGAVLDIPESLMALPGMMKSGFELVNPTQWAEHNPIDKLRSGAEGISGMFRTMMEAGAKPEEFGRMMGQTTGQPLVTAGLAKGIGPATRLAGTPTEAIGRVMRKHTPLTGMPVISPLAGRNLMKLERLTGKGIEKLGQGMKSVGKSKSLEMPLSEGEALPQAVMPESIPETYKVIRQENSPKLKPKLRMNQNGTFTNLDTGEIVNAKGESIIEINGKPIVKDPVTKDSPFFTRNRKQSKAGPLDIYKNEKGSVTINPYNKNKIDIPVGQEGGTYASELLDNTLTNTPGVSIRDLTPSIKDSTRFRKDYEIAYGDSKGKPIAVARYRAYPNGVFDITDFAADKSKGLLYGRAVEGIVNKLQKMGITNVTGSVSPDLLNYINKKLKK